MKRQVVLVGMLALVLASPAAAEVRYTVTDLTELWLDCVPFSARTLFDGPWFARALNDRGQVVGSVESTLGNQYAFLWSESGGLRDLGNLGQADSVAGGVNNLGQVVGFSTTSELSNRAKYPFLWKEMTGMRSLGSLSTTQAVGSGGCWRAYASDVNEQGAVVGTSESDEMDFAAFIWNEANGMQPVGDFVGDFSAPTAINNHCQVVGYADSIPDDDEELRRAFVWDSVSGTQMLPLTGGDTTRTYSEALDINDRGDIVGHIERFPDIGIPDSGYRLAVLWRDGEPHDLGSLGGNYASARAINEDGVVVGNTGTPYSVYSRAFVWDEEHGMRDLNDLVMPSELILHDVRDINNKGWILADALYGDGAGISHTVLLRPVPEPSLAVLAVTLACGVLVFRERLSRTFRCL